MRYPRFNRYPRLLRFPRIASERFPRSSRYPRLIRYSRLSGCKSGSVVYNKENISKVVELFESKGRKTKIVCDHDGKEKYFFECILQDCKNMCIGKKLKDMLGENDCQATLMNDIIRAMVLLR